MEHEIHNIKALEIAAAATQTTIAGFVATHNQRAVLLLTVGAAVYVSGAPHIQAGVKVGQLLTILITNDANRVTITDGAGTGTQLNGHWVVADGQGIGATLRVVWDGTRWWEIDRKNGELNVSGLVAYGEGAHAIATGEYAHAEGTSANVTGYAAHGEGYSPYANGTAAHAEGYDTSASNTGAHSEGQETTANGPQSHASGKQSTASLQGEFAQSGGQFAARGDAQFSRAVKRISTIDATLTETFVDGVDDLLTILDEYTYACKVMVAGRQDTGVDHFMGTYHVLIERTGGTVALVGAVDVIYENNAGGWGAGGGLPVSILAGATNLEVWVEGLAAHNIRWVVTVEMIRIGYAN